MIFVHGGATFGLQQESVTWRAVAVESLLGTPKGTGVVLSWAVPTAQRERYQADEDPLFAPVVCR